MQPSTLTYQELQAAIAKQKAALQEAWQDFYAIPTDEEFGRQTPEHGEQHEHIKYVQFELEGLEEELATRVLKPLPKPTATSDEDFDMDSYYAECDRQEGLM
jgi:hypothetical protein